LVHQHWVDAVVASTPTPRLTRQHRNRIAFNYLNQRSLRAGGAVEERHAAAIGF
jgi:hypothetical protein